MLCVDVCKSTGCSADSTLHRCDSIITLGKRQHIILYSITSTDCTLYIQWILAHRVDSFKHFSEALNSSMTDSLLLMHHARTKQKDYFVFSFVG